MVAFLLTNPFSDLLNPDCLNLRVSWNKLIDHVIYSGPSSLKWNENLKAASVQSERSTFGGGLFGLQFEIGLFVIGTGNLIFDRKIRI